MENSTIIQEINEITNKIQNKESQIMELTREIRNEKSRIEELKEKYKKLVELSLKDINRDIFIPLRDYKFFNFIKRQTGKRFDVLRKPGKYSRVNYDEYLFTDKAKNVHVRWNIIEEKITSHNKILEVESVDVSNLIEKLLKEKQNYKPFPVNSKEVLKKMFLISFLSIFRNRFSYFQFRTFCTSKITEQEFNEVLYDAKLDFFMEHRDIHSSIEENERHFIKYFNFKKEDFNEETRKAMRVRESISLLNG